MTLCTDNRDNRVNRDNRDNRDNKLISIIILCTVCVDTSECLVSDNALSTVPIVSVSLVLDKVFNRYSDELLTEGHSNETSPLTNY